VFAVPRISLIEDLTKGSVRVGSNLLVEFDPASQWYNASISIATEWVRTGGTVGYNALGQSPDVVRLQLDRLGLTADQLERNDKLILNDFYTSTLGQKSKEKYAYSLKVADLSIQFSQDIMRRPSIPSWLGIWDNISALARFNDNRAWVEFILTRGIPTASIRERTIIRGIMKGIHDDWIYKQLEGASDGVVDLGIEETSEGIINMIRIRNMRHVPFDSRWHPLSIGENFEVTLQK
jgi:KaiC/GvpD/RAD55 family RecA-like ATPase